MNEPMTAYILNLLDLAFTLHALRHGAVELNPFMRNIPFQCFYKVVLVGVLCWLLDKWAIKYQVARWGLWSVTAVFAAVDVWHIVNIAPSFWAVLFR